MSHSVPQRPILAEAARGDAPSTPHADRPLPEFPQHAQPDAHSPIEREIERSERASAALAAARAVARASSNDSQLEGADGDIDTADWVRTEYAALDQSVRAPQEDVPHAGTPRNLVGGSFNPGIAHQAARPFATTPIGQSPIKTRGGAQARFMHEARQAPRAERPGAPATSRLDLSAGGAHYDKPAVVPMLVNPVAAPGVRAGGAAPGGARLPRRAEAPSEALKFAVAAGVGAIAVLLGGGLAWKAGWLSHSRPDDAALITAQVAAQAEAARVLSTAQPDIAVVPAAGPAVTTTASTSLHRSDEEINAALAAAARAAAVPVASVHAAGPARPVAPAPVPVSVSTTLPPTPVVPSANAAAPQRAAAPTKDSVAAAIAKAQARADSFLAAGTPATPGEAPAAAAEVKTTP